VRSEHNLGPAGGWAIGFEEFLKSAFDYAWVFDDDIVALVDDEVMRDHERIRFVSLDLHAGSKSPPRAEMELEVDGVVKSATASGDGPVDATFRAIQQIFPHTANLVLFSVGALYFLVAGLTAPVFPFFGRYLTGLPGGACLLAVAALDGYLAVATFRLRPAAWWIAVIALPLRLLSMILTYLKADVMEAYARMGRSDAELRMLESSPLLRGHVVLWWSLVSVIAFFGYLVWLKRYFKSPSPQAEISPTMVA